MSFWQILKSVVKTLSITTTLLFVQANVLSSEKELTEAEAKAYYLFSLLEQIEWPESIFENKYHIAVLGKYPELIEALNRKKQDSENDKKIRIFNPSTIDFPLNSFSVIFITDRKQALFNRLYARQENSLLVSDGKTARDDQMISFRIFDNRLMIQMNRAKLDSKNLKPSLMLIEMAGTKDDLKAHIEEQEEKYNALLQEVKQKEQSLLNLNLKLDLENKKLLTATTALKANQRALSLNQEKLLELASKEVTSQKELQSNLNQIEEQKAIITLKQDEIKDKIISISELEKTIKTNKKILEEQLSRIAEQKAKIDNKQETIKEQRQLIIIVSVAIIIFAALIYWLIRINRSRIIANHKLKELNSRLYELATTDSLSNLSNRRHFLELSQKELLHSKRKNIDIAMLMIDIDHFKLVNDDYGHHAGDLTIQYVAKQLKSELREYDLIGRLGGEEFAMMLQDCDLKKAKEIAKRLCSKVNAENVSPLKEPLKVSVSIGISLMTENDTGIEDVLKRADEALYLAKDSGRNTVKSIP
jgi:diguanylate cyclase (GGDEF)-like protein